MLMREILLFPGGRRDITTEERRGGEEKQDREREREREREEKGSKTLDARARQA
jgi:hypothetical protein